MKGKMFTFKTCLLCFIGKLGFPAGSDNKKSDLNPKELGSVPGLGRYPREGHGDPLQNSCLENLHEQRSLVGCSLWGQKESDMIE